MTGRQFLLQRFQRINILLQCRQVLAIAFPKHPPGQPDTAGNKDNYCDDQSEDNDGLTEKILNTFPGTNDAARS